MKSLDQTYGESRVMVFVERSRSGSKCGLGNGDNGAKIRPTCLLNSRSPIGGFTSAVHGITKAVDFQKPEKIKDLLKMQLQHEQRHSDIMIYHHVGA